jgi:predicted ATPase with chaperone activity
MTEIRTVDSIMNWMSTEVEQKRPINPHLFVEAAKYLNALIGEEHEKLWELEQQVAQARLEARKTVKTMAEANAIVESTDVYRMAKLQKAKIDQVNEMIRLAKLQARLSNDELKNY